MTFEFVNEGSICDVINLSAPCVLETTLQFQIIGGGGCPTENLNINKRGGVQIKGRGSKKCSRSKVATRPVINYGCPQQLLIVEKELYNFSWSVHLYIKQLSNVSPPLLLFWCLVSCLFKKNERAYIVAEDEIKTDN